MSEFAHGMGTTACASECSAAKDPKQFGRCGKRQAKVSATIFGNPAIQFSRGQGQLHPTSTLNRK